MSFLHVLQLWFVVTVFPGYPLSSQYTCTASDATDVACDPIESVCRLDHPDYLAVCPHTMTAPSLSGEVCSDRVAFTLLLVSLMPLVYETTLAKEICVSTSENEVGLPF